MTNFSGRWRGMTSSIDLSVKSHEDFLWVQGSSQPKFGLHVRKVEFDGEETSAGHFDMEKRDK